MSTIEIKQLAIRALANMKGDDTCRAEMSFRGLSPKQMKEQHGESGKTRAPILAEYKTHDERIDTAIAWVRAANKTEL